MSCNEQVFSENVENNGTDHRVPFVNFKDVLKRTKAEVKIENVVATADLGQRLDLEAILKVTPGARYNPQRFPGLIYKVKRPEVTALLFASGKMVCTGARSTRSAKKAIVQIIKELKYQGIIIIGTPDTKIQNIVASSDLHGTIDLEIVAERLSKSMYEPEQFPGLIHIMYEPKAVFLVFASGKIVCLGTKTDADVKLAIENLRDTLEFNQLVVPADSTPSKSGNLPACAIEVPIIPH